MSKQSNLVCRTYVAAADLSGHQYKAVKLDTDGKIVAAGDDEMAIGVLQNKPTLGQAGSVAVSGATKMKLGGTVAAGSKAAVGALGVLKVADAASNVLGIVEVGGVANDVGVVLLGVGGALAV